MWIPDPRWEEPNLLIPGKKPYGPVEINWSHPMAKGLKHFWLLNRFPAMDLVTGIQAVNNGATMRGDLVDFDGGSDYLSVPDSGLSLDATLPFTILWRMDVDTVPGNFTGLFAPKRSGTNENYNIFNSDLVGYGPITFRAVGLDSKIRFSQSNFGVSPLGDHNWGVTYNGQGVVAGNIITYKDHLSGNHETSGNTVATTETSIGRYTSGREMDGRLYYLTVWQRDYPAAAVQGFFQNPYSPANIPLLIPK